MRDNRLNWFRCVMRREESVGVRIVGKINVCGKRDKRKPKEDGWM